MQKHSVSWVILSTTLIAVLASGCGALKRWGYSPSDRDDWQQPDRVLWTLGVKPGQSIADLGAGGGYFTFRLARAVGSDGRIYAVDVDEDMTDYLSEEAADQEIANVEVILASFDDAKLSAASVDLILTVNTFHHLSDRVAYFQRLKPALRPGGRIAIIELNGEGFFQRWGDHFTDAGTISDEMAAAGFDEVAHHDFLEKQHFLVFAPRDPGAPAGAVSSKER